MAQSQLLEPPPAHVPVVAGVPYGDITREDQDILQKRPEGYDVTERYDSSYVPYWSHPHWTEGHRFATDGKKYIWLEELGDPAGVRRPALVPADELNFPTDFARRFGVRPDHKYERDFWGHSSLTPTNPNFQTSAQAPEDDEYDRSLQAIVLDGYTTEELVQQNALTFTSQTPVLWPPDVGIAPGNPVHPLLRRDKWTQVPPTTYKSWAGVFDVRYGPNLDGVGGSFDMQNQRVWDAVEPALRLVTKVISSNHSYMEALLCIHNYRPVDPAKDGRTARQRTKQGNVPYASVWLDKDDVRAPAPYPEMLNLKALLFGDAAARASCWRLMAETLTFSIYWDDTNNGLTTSSSWYGDDLSTAPPNPIRICISATLIWPLLLSRQITDSERLAHTFEVANTLLHELAHAIVLTQKALLTCPAASQNTLSEPVLTSLFNLGNEMFGQAVRFAHASGQTRFARLGVTCVFTEDEAMGEDGVNLEKQLWGNRLVVLPATSNRASHRSPVLGLSNWPAAHSQPYQQGVDGGREVGGKGPYTRYLLSPRVQSWDQVQPLPLDGYGRFFSEAWWGYSHQRYGEAGLRLGSYDCETAAASGFVPPVALPRTSPNVEIDHDVIKAVLGKSTFDYLVKTARGLLLKSGLHIMNFYLLGLMRQAAQLAILMGRFANEQAAWDFKYQQMERLAVDCAQKYQVMVNAIDEVVYSAASLPFFTPVNAGLRIHQMSTVTREAMRSMIKLCQTITQEVAYQQNILNLHLQVEQRSRSLFFNYLSALRTRFTNVWSILNAQTINVLLNNASPPGVGGDWQNALQQKLAVDLGNDSTLPVVEAERQMFFGYLDEIKKLHQDFVARDALVVDNYILMGCFQADGSLDPGAADRSNDMKAILRSRRLRNFEAFRPAALREMSRMTDAPMLRLVQGALRLLEPHLNGVLDPARRALGAGDEEIQLMREARLLVLNEKQLYADRDAAAVVAAGGVFADLTAVAVTVAPTPEELMEKIMDKAGGDESHRAFLAANWNLETVQTYWDLADPSIPPP